MYKRTRRRKLVLRFNFAVKKFCDLNSRKKNRRKLTDEEIAGNDVILVPLTAIPIAPYGVPKRGTVNIGQDCDSITVNIVILTMW